jgi:hypothetical protein
MRNAVLERLAAERDSINAQIDDVLHAIEDDGRDPSEAERELLTRQRQRLTDLEPQIALQLDIEETREQSRDARAVLERARVSVPENRRNDDEQNDRARGTGNQVLYRTFAEYARDEIIARFDSIAVRAGMTREQARERVLTRAVANTITSDVPGLLPPQHLAQIIDVISTARPIVTSARQITLQNGKLTYPKITQRPTVSKQAAEKTETPSQKMVVAMNEVLADTFLGAGDLSWQTINWTVPDALLLWFQLAAEAYAIQTETAAGATIVAAATPDSVPVASDDFPGWYAAIVAAAGMVMTNARVRADTIWADVATGFKLAGLASNMAPVFNAAGTINATTGQGSIAGMTLVTSPGLSNPAVIVGNSQLLLCAETAGAPVELRAVEPSIGGMEVGVIGAFASEAMEPAAFVHLVPPAPPPLSASTAASGK